MSSIIRKPITYLKQAPSLGALRLLLQQLFARPEPLEILDVVTSFLRRHSLPLNDFPRIEGTYSRTILHRHKNGYEGDGPANGVRRHYLHSRPSQFVFYYVIEGQLKIDNYIRTATGLAASRTMVFTSGEGFHAIGEPGRFDNSIHQVQAEEETLSLHIFSDDGTKGEYLQPEIRSGQTGDPAHTDSPVSANQRVPWCGPMELFPVE